MDYILYTTVDITNTGMYRNEIGKEDLRQKEQNFQTVLQLLGIRANVHYNVKPDVIVVPGRTIGFETTEVVRAWRFSFSTERENLFELNGDPIGYLLEDFNGVPYISGLDECMEQNYSVFVTDGPSKNIVFQQRQ